MWISLLKTCTFPHCVEIFSITTVIFAISLTFFAIFWTFSRFRARKVSETPVFLEISALKLDKVQEFVENIENKDYFPELFVEKRAISTKNPANREVVVHQPVIVRENAKKNN